MCRASAINRKPVVVALFIDAQSFAVREKLYTETMLLEDEEAARTLGVHFGATITCWRVSSIRGKRNFARPNEWIYGWCIVWAIKFSMFSRRTYTNLRIEYISVAIIM